MRVSRIKNKKEEKLEKKIDVSLLDPFIKKYKNEKGNLIPLLQHAQELYGYLPQEAFHKLERETQLTLNDMYGVASFYAQFSLFPKGKYIIKMCTGTACHVKGSNTLVEFIHEKLKTSETKHTTEDGLFTVEIVSCLGACGLAPVMVINEKVYGKVTSKMCEEIVEDIIKKENQ
ncbi:MAG TPA: NAD(P)H-dependent oxidoreductase subunit E [Bacteroidales bacterium]|nr:NAD(P)H-dependent oxidoreductase subunit E [Bacteroidales bacterium]HPS16454.1 NAD(P)H-dependent oxidoreductase subunit E [Bacteroidales bacterium]HQH18094.1 NAD(P)H-dependent oxidoreductase subunit E [Bacteroidales bacterium]HQI44597.1 NAD(P)H-dependent oxidoreductase subunit E [Bacteroidales bacterium]